MTKNFRMKPLKHIERNGIKHEFTNPYLPAQNDIYKHLNQTLMDGVHTILHESKLSLNFWPEAILYYTYTLNRVCHQSQNKTPFENHSGNKPSIRHLCTFDTTTYVGVPKQTRSSKFEPKAKKGVLVEYAMSTHGYRVCGY